jgi:protein-disulfide isomerase
MQHVTVRFRLLLAALLLLVPLAAAAKPFSIADAMKDRVLGNAKAPVTMIEYASLSCPHCADFADHTLPKIEKNFIDTGKVKLIYRDYPFDGPAFAAAMVSRCAPPKRYFEFIKVLFANQDIWARTSNPRAGLARIAKLGGMTDAQFNSCVDNKDLYKALRQRALSAQREFGVHSTPTFLIDGKKIVGAQPYMVFAKALTAAANK